MWWERRVLYENGGASFFWAASTRVFESGSVVRANYEHGLGVSIRFRYVAALKQTTPVVLQMERRPLGLKRAFYGRKEWRECQNSKIRDEDSHTPLSLVAVQENSQGRRGRLSPTKESLAKFTRSAAFWALHRPVANIRERFAVAGWPHFEQ